MPSTHIFCDGHFGAAWQKIRIKKWINYSTGGQNGLVSIALGYGLENWGTWIQVLAEAKIFPFPTVSRSVVAHQAAYQRVMRAASLPCKAAKAWSCPLKVRMQALYPTVPYILMVWHCIQHTDNFTSCHLLCNATWNLQDIYEGCTESHEQQFFVK